MDVKMCTKCKRIKPLSDFNKHYSPNSGIRSECKHCQYAMQAIRKKRLHGPSMRRPEQTKAHNAMVMAKKEGILIVPNNCSMCGNGGLRIEGHHEDYSKPLDVIWVCCKCHTAIHRKIA